MKKISLYILIAFSFVFTPISCSNDDEILDSNAPIFLWIYFHNKDNEDKVLLKDLDVTIEYTTPKGKTTAVTNDELYKEPFEIYYDIITEPNIEGIRLAISFFPVNYPDDIRHSNVRGSVKKFKIILRKKGDDKIIFENTFTYTFEDREGNPFVFVKSLEIEKPDLENMKKGNLGYHIYLDLD